MNEEIIVIGGIVVYAVIFIFFILFVYLFYKFILGMKKFNLKTQVYNLNFNKDTTIRCDKCNSVITDNQKDCKNCGETIVENNIFCLSKSDTIYEDLDNELKKLGLDKNSILIPSVKLRRRKKFNIIFSVLLFIFVSLIFFHLPLYVYVYGIRAIAFLFIIMNHYNFIEYLKFIKNLKKEIEARPNQNVSNIVINLTQTTEKDTSGKILVVGILISIILPILIFMNPIIWYEKVEGGYGVKYYTFGITNFKSVTIPQKYKGEDILILRDNIFANMPFLKEVILPDTITEIGEHVFKNNTSLKTIKLPSNLNYLGLGAFYNCTELESIQIPDSVTYIGEKAFYGNNSLYNVVISQNSQLKEISSFAFGLCPTLYSIYVPEGISINKDAFQESPTHIKNYGELYN